MNDHEKFSQEIRAVCAQPQPFHRAFVGPRPVASKGRIIMTVNEGAPPLVLPPIDGDPMDSILLLRGYLSGSVCRQTPFTPPKLT